MRQSLSKESESQVVAARGLVKRFGRARALDGLDLTVEKGESHGFLGSNGAGKSTTIRAILGQLRLDAGSLSVFGRHPRRDAVAIHAQLAYVPGDTALWPGLTGGECIDLIGRFSGRQDRRRRDELIDAFELDPTKRARSYSKGNRQKVALVAALATRAPLLLLDEPTSGLDPVMESVFVAEVRRARDDGATVLLSSHILDEVEALCDRVTIIRGGRTVSTGTLADLRAHTSSTIDVTTPAPFPAPPGAGSVTTRALATGVRTTFTIHPAALPDALTVVAQARPVHVVVRPPSLDELFLEHYVDEKGQDAEAAA
ncbi:ABC transporter ATP-binding protein [Granulicoccus sp. GXG6511]|uniref:ABC transporter ATP-binding protein n=1 Tax=Granulicoccus sp. GXG6511 TaxID=3381351 RepID=UPI003D7CB6B6